MYIDIFTSFNYVTILIIFLFYLIQLVIIDIAIQSKFYVTSYAAHLRAGLDLEKWSD